MNYTNAEYADIHLIYGMANCNAVEARRLYVERYPNRRAPNRKTFVRTDQRLRETGMVIILIENCLKIQNSI